LAVVDGKTSNTSFMSY